MGKHSRCTLTFGPGTITFNYIFQAHIPPPHSELRPPLSVKEVRCGIKFYRRTKRRSKTAKLTILSRCIHFLGCTISPYNTALYRLIAPPGPFPTGSVLKLQVILGFQTSVLAVSLQQLIHSGLEPMGAPPSGHTDPAGKQS